MSLKIICIREEYLAPYNCKLFALTLVTWSYNYLLRIIIRIIYFKPYDSGPTNDYY